MEAEEYRKIRLPIVLRNLDNSWMISELIDLLGIEGTIPILIENLKILIIKSLKLLTWALIYP